MMYCTPYLLAPLSAKCPRIRIARGCARVCVEVRLECVARNSAGVPKWGSLLLMTAVVVLGQTDLLQSNQGRIGCWPGRSYNYITDRDCYDVYSDQYFWSFRVA